MVVHNEWMPRAEWDALVKGESCPMCSAVVSKEPFSESNYTVAHLDSGILWLRTNQYVRGYSVLVCRQHVREPYQLKKHDRIQFFEDLMLVGEVLEKVYNADKMNFEILGNSTPHLHCHIIPRYYGDPAPNQPMSLPFSEVVKLKPEEYIEQVKRIRDALFKKKSNSLRIQNNQII